MKPRTPPGAQCGSASAQRCPSILVLIVAGTEDPRGRINPASAARGPLLFLLSSYCWGPSAHTIVFGRWLGPLPRQVLWSIISFCDPISHPSCTLLSCSPSRDHHLCLSIWLFQRPHQLCSSVTSTTGAKRWSAGAKTSKDRQSSGGRQVKVPSSLKNDFEDMIVQDMSMTWGSSETYQNRSPHHLVREVIREEKTSVNPRHSGQIDLEAVAMAAVTMEAGRRFCLTWRKAMARVVVIFPIFILPQIPASQSSSSRPPRHP